jgi:RNA polymerase sigma factor (sigma-70 family)
MAALGDTPLDGVEALLRPNGWATRFVGYRSRRVVRRSINHSEDAEDFAQEFFLAIVRSWPRFSPVRGKWTTYVARIVDSTETSMRRRRGRKKRAARLCAAPLDAIAWAGGEGAEEANHLRLDVTAQVNQLEPRLRKVCVALMHHSPTDAARSLGIHRSTLYEHIAVIRERFDDEGLRSYTNCRGAAFSQKPTSQ